MLKLKKSKTLEQMIMAIVDNGYLSNEDKINEIRNSVNNYLAEQEIDKRISKNLRIQGKTLVAWLDAMNKKDKITNTQLNTMRKKYSSQCFPQIYTDTSGILCNSPNTVFFGCGYMAVQVEYNSPLIQHIKKDISGEYIKDTDVCNYQRFYKLLEGKSSKKDFKATITYAQLQAGKKIKIDGEKYIYPVSVEFTHKKYKDIKIHRTLNAFLWIDAFKVLGLDSVELTTGIELTEGVLARGYSESAGNYKIISTIVTAGNYLIKYHNENEEVKKILEERKNR